MILAVAISWALSLGRQELHAKPGMFVVPYLQHGKQQFHVPAAQSTQSVSTVALNTVEDRPDIPPTFNGVNTSYPNLHVLHSQPPVFSVHQFLSAAECDCLIRFASDSFTPAPVVGKGSGEVSESRTSSTCYLAREDLPWYVSKISALTGNPAEHCELPQIGRYLPTQRYLKHYDAFDLSTDDGRRFASNGGQRIVTVLVYLNDVKKGGAPPSPIFDHR